MANDWLSVNARCPYFDRHADNIIRCAGICDKQYGIMVLSSVWELQKYVDRYCCSIEGCKSCKYYQLLDLLYDLGVLDVRPAQKSIVDRVQDGAAVQMCLEDYMEG